MQQCLRLPVSHMNRYWNVCLTFKSMIDRRALFENIQKIEMIHKVFWSRETKNIAFLCILYTRAKSLDSHIFTRYTKTYCYGMVIMNYGT